MLFADDLATPLRLKSPHAPRSTRTMLMVALYPLLLHRARAMVHLRQHGQGRRVQGRLVGRQRIWRDVRALECSRQKHRGSCSIPQRTDRDVDDLTILVDCSDTVTPPADGLLLSQRLQYSTCHRHIGDAVWPLSDGAA